MPKSLPDGFFSGSSPIAIVAGGAGFVGSHVCERLLAKSVKVICVDDWQTGVRENIRHLGDDKNFALLEVDITKKLPDFDKVDYVLHLAAIEAYINGEDVSIETLEANSIGTSNLLDTTAKHKARFLLASTIHIVSSHIGTKTTEDYFGSSREGEGEFSHHESKRFAEALASEYAIKKKIDSRVVRLGDVYGPRMMLSSGNPLADLIKQALYNKPLKVPGQDFYVFPVFVDDAVLAIEKSLFSSGTRNAIIPVAGDKKSLFDVAQRIKNIRENVEVEFGGAEFAKEEIPTEILAAGESKISWQPETTLEKGIEQTLSWFEEHRAQIPSEKVVEKSRKVRGQKSFWSDVASFASREKPKGETASSPKQKRRGRWFWPTTVVAAILFWFFLFPFLQLGIGVAHLYFAKQAVAGSNSRHAEIQSSLAKFWFLGSEGGFARWTFIPLIQDRGVVLAQSSSKLAQVADIGKTASRVLEQAQGLLGSIVGEQPLSVQPLADELALELGVLERQLSFLEAEGSGQVEFPSLDSAPISETFGLSSVRQAISVASQILPQAADLLGEKGEKVYLVLLQNNMELRPTGGFIGSFGILRFNEGRLVDFEVQDVYSADGQLKGHVEPPGPIKEYLGEANWFLRDSNWDPDFPTSAQRAAWFIDKELGLQVDGVVGIDLEFVKNLLREMGSLELVDFGETVTADNIYEKTQFAAEGDFFPGSRAKKDFLTAIARTLFLTLSQDPEKHVIAVGKSAVAALEQRHSAAWFRNTSTSAALRRVGWDGGVQNISCTSSSGCVADYLQVVEANLGVNKSNYFLERTYSLEMATNGFLSHRLAISYVNKSEIGVWPGGDYKNYLRILAPSSSVLKQAYLLNPATGEEEELEVDVRREGGKRTFGMLALVPAGESRQVVISWEMPEQPIAQLLFLWQKQLGSSPDPAWVRLTLPATAGVVEAFPTASLTDRGEVGYNSDLSEDLFFNIKWQTQ